MLAARGFGLGTVLTSAHRQHGKDVKALGGIPEDVETVALVPVGYPERSFGPVPRKPVEDVLHWESW